MNNDLKSISMEIDKCFYAHEGSVRKTINEQNKILVRASKECEEAITHGDLRENAQYERAVQDMQQAQKIIRDNEAQLSGIVICMQEMKRYARTGAITAFSTVHLRLIGNMPNKKECKSLKNEYFFKLFMAGVSDTANGILAVESGLGQMLIGKRVGDVVKLKHQLSGVSVSYRIEDFI